MNKEIITRQSPLGAHCPVRCFHILCKVHGGPGVTAPSAALLRETEATVTFKHQNWDLHFVILDLKERNDNSWDIRVTQSTNWLVLKWRCPD